MMMAFAWTVGVGDDRKGRKENCHVFYCTYISVSFCLYFVRLMWVLYYVRLQILILKILGWVGTVHLAETEVKIWFPSKVTSQISGGNFSCVKTRGRSCMSSAKPVTIRWSWPDLSVCMGLMYYCWLLCTPHACCLGCIGLGQTTYKLKRIYAPILLDH